MEKRLEKRLTKAVQIGAMSPEEADDVRERVGVVWGMGILELIRMIIDVIAEWLGRRPSDVERAFKIGNDDFFTVAD
jgi:hypothetical protein